MIAAPENIMLLALISQICMFGIMLLGCFSIAAGRIETLSSLLGRSPTYAYLGWLLSIWLFTSVVAFGFSDVFSVRWRSFAELHNFSGIPWKTSLLLVFLLDIGSLSFLVAKTGGSRFSPFTPLFFLLPTLAIFLREPVGRITLYAILIGAIFAILLFWTYPARRATWENNEEAHNELAYFIVSILCLALACFVGIISRPQ